VVKAGQNQDVEPGTPGTTVKMSPYEALQWCLKTMAKLQASPHRRKSPASNARRADWSTCCHEAGHAIATVVLQQRLVEVAVTGSGAGYTRHAGRNFASLQLWRPVVVAYAGYYAQESLAKNRNAEGGRSDLVRATLLSVAACFRNDSQYEVLAVMCSFIARRVVRVFKKSILTIARQLRTRHRLSGSQVRGIMLRQDHWRPSKKTFSALYGQDAALKD